MAALKLKDNELRMAGQLIKDMATRWNPKHYADTFTDAINALIARKVKAGKTETVEPFEQAPAPASNVVELTELLRRSLSAKKETRRAAPARAARKRTTEKSAVRKRA